MGVLRDEIGLNWMHDNHSTYWAQTLPFIQWRCNTQSHRGIGDRTPYHLMFGQHPHVGISNLPIDPSLLSSLATEMDVYHSMGLPDMPLESANLVSSLGAYVLVENSLQTIISPEVIEMPMNFFASKQSHLSSNKNTNEKKKQPVRQAGGKISPGDKQSMMVKNKELPFHSDGFNTDVTDRIIKVLQEKATVCTKEVYTYFGWMGVGFQCGVCFNSLPKLDCILHLIL